MKSQLTPDKNGYFGEFGGQYVPELLIAPLAELQSALADCQTSPTFNQQLTHLLKTFCARPTPLTRASGLEKITGLPAIYLKREDCLHTGAHKLNNALGQVLLAQHMGKTRVIAETGAGQHGVATATACAKLGLDCTVYMGQTDMARQAPNVARMQLLGATVVPVTSNHATLKEAVSAAMRDWSANLDTSAYCLGSALGPHPFPAMVAYFQSVIGIEARAQILTQHRQLPDAVIACLGGGSNAIGTFDAFLNDKCKLIAVEAGGCGTALGQHASRFRSPQPGILHGTKSMVLQDEHGQIAPTASISAGLDYPMIGPSHAYLFTQDRVHYTDVNDSDVIEAVTTLARNEGIIAALESAHAIAYCLKHPPQADCVLITVSGRGDKDMQTLAKHVPTVTKQPTQKPIAPLDREHS